MELFNDDFKEHWRELRDDLCLTDCPSYKQKILNIVNSNFEEEKKYFKPEPGNEKSFVLPVSGVKERDGTPMGRNSISFPR